jgi:hypothetical protein
MTITKAQAQLIADTLFALDGIEEVDQQFIAVTLVDRDRGVVGNFTEEEGTWLFFPIGA